MFMISNIATSLKVFCSEFFNRKSYMDGKSPTLSKKPAEGITKSESVRFIRPYENSKEMDLSELKPEQIQLSVELQTEDTTVLLSKGEIFLINALNSSSASPKELSCPQKIESYPTQSNSWGQTLCEFLVLALENNDIEKQFEVIDTIKAEIRSRGHENSRFVNAIWLLRGFDYLICTILNHPLIEKLEVWLDKIRIF
uniref:hypothetical protein n=1 Tax=Picosynechococcus sp. PCC 73109 TaxID=374982 RepID=UPI001E32337B|nr:hypothetical protein [Picosynechococcus sp. PCC 73109]